MTYQQDFSIYYHVSEDGKKKLRQVDVSNVECHESAIKEVMHHLHMSKESYYKPILAVIKGGKA